MSLEQIKFREISDNTINDLITKLESCKNKNKQQIQYDKEELISSINNLFRVLDEEQIYFTYKNLFNETNR